MHISGSRRRQLLFCYRSFLSSFFNAFLSCVFGGNQDDDDDDDDDDGLPT